MEEQQSNNKRSNCVACTFMKHGVKTRKSIPHTCGKTIEELIKELRNSTKNNQGGT